MRTKVYSFKPKGKSYDIYATKTYGGIRSASNRPRHSRYSSRSGGVMSNFISGAIARFIVYGIFGMKK